MVKNIVNWIGIKFHCKSWKNFGEIIWFPHVSFSPVLQIEVKINIMKINVHTSTLQYIPTVKETLSIKK